MTRLYPRPNLHHSANGYRYPLLFLCTSLLLMVMSPCTAQQKALEKVSKYIAAGDTARALKLLNRQIEKQPAEAPLYLERAKIKLDRRDFDPAMIDLNTYCSLRETCGEASFLKGLILYRQGNYHGAIEHFSAFSREQESVTAWFYLGLSHMALQHYQVAVHSFEKAIQADPDDVKAWYNAGVCAFRNEDYAVADSLLSRAMEIAPTDTDVLLARALTLNKRADYPGSNTLLQQLLEIAPSNHSALYNIGVNYYSMDEWDLACDHWRQAEQAGSQAAEVAISDYCEGK